MSEKFSQLEPELPSEGSLGPDTDGNFQNGVTCTVAGSGAGDDELLVSGAGSGRPIQDKGLLMEGEGGGIGNDVIPHFMHSGASGTQGWSDEFESGAIPDFLRQSGWYTVKCEYYDGKFWFSAKNLDASAPLRMKSYDPTLDVFQDFHWDTIPEFSGNFNGNYGTALWDGDFWVLADFNNPQHIGKYDIDNDVIDESQTAPPVSIEQSGAVAIDGNIYVPYPKDGSDVARPDIYVYDIGADSWSTITGTSPPPERYFAAIMKDDQQRLYVVGGIDNGAGTSYTRADRLDVNTGTWEQLPDFPGPSGTGDASTGLDDEGNPWIINGVSGSSGTQLSNSYVFDTSTDSWVSVSLPFTDEASNSGAFVK